MPLPKELTTVTPFSKYLALSLFVILPLLFFYLGMQYQEQIMVQQIQNVPQYLPITPTQMLQPTSPPMKETTITDKDDNKTISVKNASTVKLVLNSTYWMLDKPSSSILQPQGDPLYAPDTRVKIPGSGIGTVTAIYNAVGIGSVTLSASRGSCGEARACTPDESHFLVHITISQ